MASEHESDETAEAEPSAAASAASDLGAYIRNQRESAKLSLRNLAKLAGVSNPYLSQIERGLRKPSAEILHAIARGLSISAESLYVRAGILDERDVDLDLEDAIDRDPFLSESQKTAMVEMYRSFRRLQKLEGAAGGSAGGVGEGGPRRNPLQGLIDSVRTGDVDDHDVAAARPDHESADEA